MSPSDYAWERLPDPLAPTAELPSLSGSRLQLVEALSLNLALQEFEMVFPSAFAEMKKTSNKSGLEALSLQKTYCKLEETHGGQGIMNDLLHAIPRDVLKSIVLGTVGFDAQHGLKGHGTSGGGVYVVSICTEPNGGFLTIKGLARLLANMQKYIDGSEAWLSREDRAGTMPANYADLAAFVSQVDTKYFGNILPDASPRFGRTGDLRASARQLKKLLQQRYDEAIKHNPTGETVILQSPVLVGSSGCLIERCKKYDLVGGSLKDVSKTYTLLMSLLGVQGANPRPSVLTPIRIWEPGQLGDAELLVTALANSYIMQDGLNVTECGQNKDTQTATQFHEAAVYVCATDDTLRNNLDISEKWAREYDERVDKILSMSPLTNSNIEKDWEVLSNKFDDLIIAAEEVAAKEARFREAKAKRERLTEEWRQEAEFREEMLAIFKEWDRVGKEVREERAARAQAEAEAETVQQERI
ncbi:hypothetical protein QBC37DRAFT_374332 [Rhypophila decipiens]|uniref:Uncharacterized protein n=1 Tax=Rhypophila decipiens TaxID=261697 RepID=A0AAN6Y6I5_9PEZI|nr:hypothetical protein QBC37DRAFT_374332 [Rhypophila decipiens]